MHLKQVWVLLLVTVIIWFAVILGRVFHLIEIRHHPIHVNHHETQGDSDSTHFKLKQNHGPAIMNDSPEQVFWFIQISDIHISMFHDPDRIIDLKEFCDVTVNTIEPSVVLASGDLADGKASDHMGSDQYIEEWKTYKRVLEETKVVQKTIWLDIRGNHDNFNVPGVLSDRSFYHQFSVQGEKHLRSYMYTVNKGLEKYSFIAVDACLEPGPRRPFNFIGNINKEQYDLLSSFEKESQKSNATIWFGHYPTSCIISPEPGIRQLMKNGSAYLCGHLHTLGGAVPKMYSLQHSGLLELELGDWKDNRMYRVAAFDHGLFSFVDIKHKKWPVILVTNPKHAMFLLPKKEPLHLISQSSHIRVLVFSQSAALVNIKIDKEDWREMKQIQGPLYVAEWNPSLYSKGIHILKVKAEDMSGNFEEIEHPFSLDGTRLSFQFLPRIALMTDAQHVFHGCFITVVIVSILPLLLMKFLHYLVKANKIRRPDFYDTFFGNFVRRLWILGTINKLCLPLVFYPLYLTVGPWFIGEIIEGHIGASFAWGTVVNWTVLPTSFTYFYGTIQVFWFHIPFVLILSFVVDARFKYLCGRTGPKKESCLSLRNIICSTHILVQMIFAFYFWQAYGTLAFILGFMRTWSVFMAIYLWYKAANLPQSEFAESKLIWGRHEVGDDGDTIRSENGEAQRCSME